MAPWELIKDESYKQWLLDTPMTSEEYNGATLPDRRTLRSEFIKEQQQQQQQVKRPKVAAYSVSVVVEGALSSAGARGNVYKKLQHHHAVYSESQGIDVEYVGDDLVVKALFLDLVHAFNFQSDLNDWEIHKELAHLSGVRIDPKFPLEVDRPKDITRVMMQDYKPSDSESPCGSINDLHSYRLSVPTTEMVDPETPLAKYQCLDKQVHGLTPYKCHLKDKAKFKQLQSNENNILAASWTLHQMMDGLKTAEGIPMVVISVKSQESHRSAVHANRVAVTLLLEFRESGQAEWFQGNDYNAEGGLAAKRIVGTNNWETTVFVMDPILFSECIKWKYENTKKAWEEHEEFLSQI